MAYSFAQKRNTQTNMDNSIHIEELNTDQIAELIENPDGLSPLIFSNSDDWKKTTRVAMSNHNGWHIIHYLLAEDVWHGEWPLNFMADINVGTPVMYDEEYPPAKLFSPSEVAAISDALEKITPDELAKRFNRKDENLDEFDCAVDAFSSTAQFLSKAVKPDYEEIRAFVGAAAGRKNGLLVAWYML
jgi:Domain of unknown function (DUF1877)